MDEESTFFNAYIDVISYVCIIFFSTISFPMKDLFIAPSLYTFFLYILINKNWKESDYVLLDRIPKVIADRLSSKYSIDVLYYPYRKKGLNPFQRIYYSNKDFYEYRKAYSQRQYERVWGNDEMFATIPFRKQGIRIIEDGTFNSYPKSFFYKRIWKTEAQLFDFWLKRCFRPYVPYGWDKHVTEIYHTSAHPLPNEIQHKGKEICIDDLWKKKTSEEKKDILDFFGLSDSFISSINNYSTVLVTQILPISDDEKIAIYKDMLKDVDEKSLLIKTHYAEKTDYCKYFPQSEIVSMPVPMQLFSLLGYQPKKILTVSSSAIAPFVKDGVEVVFLGTEIDPRIVNAYGVIKLEDVINKK